MQGENQCTLKCGVPNHVVSVFRYLGWDAELVLLYSVNGNPVQKGINYRKYRGLSHIISMDKTRQLQI